VFGLQRVFDGGGSSSQFSLSVSPGRVVVCEGRLGRFELDVVNS
jgi:hypothetical protein